MDQPGQATRELDELAAADPLDWRIDWYRGLAAFVAEAAGRQAHASQAVAAFDAVYSALPGEPAAQLGVAVAAEWAMDSDTAARFYERVWRTDHGFVSAAFGLARQRRASGDRAGTVAVLDEVPDNSRYHTAAQVAAIRARLAAVPMALLTEADLLDAATRLQGLGLDPEPHARVAVEILHKALQFAPAVGQPTTARLLGYRLAERELRFGLERCYRTLAKVSHDRRTRAAFVDLANTIRPRTLI
jgi:serine/threonine-protein kinase PknG